MPNATAPNAPCVEVWLSPQAIVMPGCVSPSSGPITWTMPCAPLGEVEQLDAELAAVALERREHVLGHRRRRTAAAGRASGRCDRRSRTCAPGTAPASPRSRSMSNACGLVTSWTRCRPMKSCVCPLGSLRTVWASQTFWRRVELAMLAMVLRRRNWLSGWQVDWLAGGLVVRLSGWQVGRLRPAGQVGRLACGLPACRCAPARKQQFGDIRCRNCSTRRALTGCRK